MVQVDEIISLWRQGFLPPSPLARRGIVVMVWRGSRMDGWVVRQPGMGLPDLRNPYLCNHLMDFLQSKFCGIV